MKKITIILLAIVVVFMIFIVIDMNKPSLGVTSEYSNGQIITSVKSKGLKNIIFTEYIYKTYFLDQYVGVAPREEVYSFKNYEENHIYEISERILQGKQNYIEVQVLITYDDGTQEIKGETVIEDIKGKIYDDFVIEPVIKDDKVYYQSYGLSAIIDKSNFDEEVLFYSNLNWEDPNITIGFAKNHTLYNLNSYGVITQKEAEEEDYEGFSVLEFTKDPDVDESYIVVQYGMIELDWAGLYPYDLEGNEVLYESKDGSLNLVSHGKTTELWQSSMDKYAEMLEKMPEIDFKIHK